MTLERLKGLDEIFVSGEFKENKDFTQVSTAERESCRAIWLAEKEDLHTFVQDYLLSVS